MRNNVSLLLFAASLVEGGVAEEQYAWKQAMTNFHHCFLAPYLSHANRKGVPLMNLPLSLRWVPARLEKGNRISQENIASLFSITYYKLEYLHVKQTNEWGNNLPFLGSTVLRMIPDPYRLDIEAEI